MLNLKDIVKIELPTWIVELAHYQSQKKLFTCNHHGTHDPNIVGKNPLETYVDQMLSELGFAIYMYGFRTGVDVFMAEREKQNGNPHQGDNGHDIVVGVDVKSRRKNAFFNFAPIHRNMLNYDLILRDKKDAQNGEVGYSGDIHNDNPNHIFAQIIQEYDESMLLTCYTPQTATVWLTGWEYFYNFFRFEDGIVDADGKRRLKGKGWRVQTGNLQPYSKFPFSNTPEVVQCKPIASVKPSAKTAFPPKLLPTPN